MRLAKIPKFYSPYFSPVVDPLPPAFRTHTLSPLSLSTSRLIVFYAHQKARAVWGHKTTAILRFFSSLRIEVPSSRILVLPKISCHHLCIGGSLVMGDEEKNAIDNKVGRLPGEAKRILQSLASSWGDVVESDALQMIQLKGAMTNEVYQIKWPTNEEHSRKVLARIYGEGVDIFFDRNNEIQTFEFMSKHGQGPRLLGRFQNGRIEEFIHARTLSASDLRDPDTSALIAAKMKEFHDLDMPGPKNVFLWDRMRNWLNAAKSMSSREEAEAFHFDALEEEISILEKKLSTDDHRIGFCHNDLQYGNIMFDEKTRLVTLIDYEYASYNPVAYDIANHFCEMAADYHTETPHILDFSKYPGLEERKRFLRMYLSSSGDQPCDVEMEQLAQDVEKYTLASHLIWGLWGIISEHVNEIDFDYMEYARQRLQQYWLRKPELLGSFRATRVDVVDGKNVQNSAEADKSAGEEILWNLQARQE